MPTASSYSIEARISLASKVRDDWQLIDLDWEGSICGDHTGRIRVGLPGDTVPDSGDLVGKRLTVTLEDREAEPGAAATATVTGTVRSYEVDHDSGSAESVVLDFEISPRFEDLALNEHTCTYLDQRPQAVMTAVLERNDYVEGTDFEFRLTEASSYPTVACVAQFGESDMAFLRRLCEHWGISFAYEIRDGEAVWIFTDDPNALPAIQGDTLRYRDSGLRKGVTRLRRRTSQVPKDVVLHNYNHERPAQALSTTRPVTGGQTGRSIDYGVNFRAADGDGTFLARIRADERAARRTVYDGEADGVLLAAGHLLTLDGHPSWAGLRLVVVSVRTRVSLPWFTADTTATETVTQTFHAVPLTEAGEPVIYRPSRRTPRPAVHGVLHGIVEKEDDRLPRKLDDQGRYTVRLLAHSDEEDDLEAVYPQVRMAQPVGGAGAGIHFPLHPGTEVLVAFANGDPDRPYICGAAPNTRDTAPVTSDNADTNILRTAAGMRLEMVNGPLTDSGDGVTGDAIRTKLVVPYARASEADTGLSYLRLGRTDTIETTETDGPGQPWTADGWYDYTAGRRVSVTLGTATVFRGDRRIVHQHADSYRVRYDAAYAPDADGTVARVHADYGSHRFRYSATRESAYRTGTAYALLAGHSLDTIKGARFEQTENVRYTFNKAGCSELNTGNTVSYTTGAVLAAAASIDEKVGSRTMAASDFIELSLRDSGAVSDALSSHEQLHGDASDAFQRAIGAESTFESGVRAAADAKDPEAVTAGRSAWDGIIDEGESLMKSISTVSTTHQALVDTQAAKSVAGGGTGPALRLDADRFSVRAGRDDTTYAVVQSGGIQLQSGSPKIRVQIDSDGIHLINGSSYLKVGQQGIELAAPGATLNLTPQGLAASSMLNVTSTGKPAMPPQPLTSSLSTSGGSASSDTQAISFDGGSAPAAATGSSTDEAAATAEDAAETAEEAVEDDVIPPASGGAAPQAGSPGDSAPRSPGDDGPSSPGGTQ